MCFVKQKRNLGLQQKYELSRFLAGLLFFAGIIGCTNQPIAQKTENRLLLTPFRGKSVNPTLQVPILIAAEVTGRVRSRMCLLLQIDYTSIRKLQIRPQKGKFLSNSDPDLSEVIFLKYQQCKKQKIPCLIGTIDSKRKELVAQVELLTPTAGGLLSGGLYKGDCTADDTFDPKNIIAREALAIGQSFRIQTEVQTEKSSLVDGGVIRESASESTLPDGVTSNE